MKQYDSIEILLQKMKHMDFHDKIEVIRNGNRKEILVLIAHTMPMRVRMGEVEYKIVREEKTKRIKFRIPVNFTSKHEIPKETTL